jgi:hypothetical protein
MHKLPKPFDNRGFQPESFVLDCLFEFFEVDDLVSTYHPLKLLSKEHFDYLTCHNSIELLTK